jgi:hypothetical protein
MLILLASSAPIAAEEADVRLVGPPEVTRSGEEFRIAFAVDSPTDVEVAVLDRDGRVVRHLAAGVLGGQNAPPPPLQAGLAQRLTWDGQDDDGKPADGAPHRVRVRAGTRVRFGRMIGGSPYTGSVTSMPYRAPVNGLVADDAGNLLVLMMSSVGSHGNSGRWPWQLRKFDRQGSYQHTLLPYPPSTDPADASGFQLLPAGDGSFVPANRTSLYPVFAVLGNEIVPRLAGGRVVFVHSEKRELNFLATDGSNALRTVPMWPAASKLTCPSWIDIQAALAPDGKTAYYSNVAGVAYDGRKPEDIDPNWPQGRIYRQDLTKADSVPVPLFDLTLPDWNEEPYWIPSAWDKKSAAAGIDTDADGNVLVCDLVNHQVVEISPEGEQLSATKVPWPDKVMVSRKTGDLYVISREVSRGALPPATLRKIARRGDEARVAAELQLAGTIGGGFTLDESGETPVIWLAGQRSAEKKGSGALVRVEDRGAELVVTGDEFLNRDESAIRFVSYMDVDREADLVYVTGADGSAWRFDGTTGEGGPLEIRAVDVAVGPGGDIFTLGTNGSFTGPVARFSRDLKPKPSGSSEVHTFGDVYGRAGRGVSVCGLDVDSRGRVYATYGANECHVRVYDAEGKLVDFPRTVSERGKRDVPAAISGVTGFGGSLRVDRAGNIYLLQGGVPADSTVPPAFADDEAYRHAVGTIYKFPPGGGEVLSDNNRVNGVVGATARYAGCGAVSQWNAVGSCVCTKPRFDVDDYGRLYIPNSITYSVSLRDNADNEIVRFGAYGNFDCQGPGSREPAPPIPLGWPVTAGAGEEHIYVGDCLNHRIVRVDRRYAAEATIELPR